VGIEMLHVYSTREIFYLAASLPVMFSIPTHIAHFTFNKNLCEATLLVYKYNRQQKSQD